MRFSLLFFLPLSLNLSLSPFFLLFPNVTLRVSLSLCVCVCVCVFAIVCRFFQAVALKKGAEKCSFVTWGRMQVAVRKNKLGSIL